MSKLIVDGKLTEEGLVEWKKNHECVEELKSFLEDGSPMEHEPFLSTLAELGLVRFDSALFRSKLFQLYKWDICVVMTPMNSQLPSNLFTYLTKKKKTLFTFFRLY